MAHWREEYSAALAARDRREKANTALYEAYTQLADRTGRSTTTTPPNASNNNNNDYPQSPAPAGANPRTTTYPSGNTTKTTTTPPLSTQQEALLASTRADLAEAQRSRSELQDRLARVTAELDKLRKRNTHDIRRIHAFEQEVTHLQMRLKDRDEELRGKAKLLEDFQDEMASLNLQLNMAEERSARFQQENQDLIRRWMAKMGEEADALNATSKFS
ncbi:ATG16 family protein [Aspergillus homomorphus CBS 101889]|uniref:Autophagy protein 16 n=1 Tax=Aspergillus homomorphus (strain CBS 101889) TaxID=1450537 RepID=A0A395I455_ASPHC|nr:autophagy protein 16 [Aspergillus homomorphus CBS 101889]RAL13968.1 autophagy protein 16 [Aspergillus homomorphus CBS 101889]